MEAATCENLWTAAGEGRLSEVCQLVQAGVDINQSFSDGLTALHFATAQGHADIVQYLVECGASVNRASDSGVTPLMCACSQGFIDLVRFLVQSGANVNAVSSSYDSPLLYLCKKRLKRTRISTGRDSVHEFYKICYSEKNCGCLDLVKLLVGAGADVNLIDCDGNSALMGFILSNHFEVAKFLVICGAKTNHANKEGVTALLLTCRLKHTLELVEMLISAGADVNHAKAPEGTTSLMAACYSSVDNVEALIKAGASVNATNSKGETALKSAVFATNPSIIEVLIKAGVRIDKEFILAVIIGHGESIQTLITNGALPRMNGNMPSLKQDIEYLSRRFSVWTSNFLAHRLLAHLDALGITSLTPFMVALMRKDDVVARFFIRNYFFHPLDILLLEDFKKKGSTLEDDGLSPCFLPVITQPWSLFSLSFLCISFAMEFESDREKRVSLAGLPNPLQLTLLYRGKDAFLPVQEWASLKLII